MWQLWEGLLCLESKPCIGPARLRSSTGDSWSRAQRRFGSACSGYALLHPELSTPVSALPWQAWNCYVPISTSFACSSHVSVVSRVRFPAVTLAHSALIAGDYLPSTSEPSSLLEDAHLRALAAAVPLRHRWRRWRLVYATARDGISLSTLYRHAACRALRLHGGLTCSSTLQTASACRQSLPFTAVARVMYVAAWQAVKSLPCLHSACFHQIRQLAGDRLHWVAWHRLPGCLLSPQRVAGSPCRVFHERQGAMSLQDRVERFCCSVLAAAGCWADCERAGRDRRAGDQRGPQNP